MLCGAALRVWDKQHHGIQLAVSALIDHWANVMDCFNWLKFWESILDGRRQD